MKWMLIPEKELEALNKYADLMCEATEDLALYDGYPKTAIEAFDMSFKGKLAAIPADALLKVSDDVFRIAGNSVTHGLVCAKGLGAPLGGKCTCGLDDAKEIMRKVKKS